MKYGSVLKKDEVLTHPITQMNLENIMGNKPDIKFLTTLHTKFIKTGEQIVSVGAGRVGMEG
jgi:hypothetical protein